MTVSRTVTTHLAFLGRKLLIVTLMTLVTVFYRPILGKHLLAGASAAVFAVLDADSPQRGCQALELAGESVGRTGPGFGFTDAFIYELAQGHPQLGSTPRPLVLVGHQIHHGDSDGIGLEGAVGSLLPVAGVRCHERPRTPAQRFLRSSGPYGKVRHPGHTFEPYIFDRMERPRNGVQERCQYRGACLLELSPQLCFGPALLLWDRRQTDD